MSREFWPYEIWGHSWFYKLCRTCQGGTRVLLTPRAWTPRAHTSTSLCYSSVHSPNNGTGHSHKSQSWPKPGHHLTNETIHYCSQVYCRCFLYRCIRRAFLLAQNVEQWGQWSPGMLRCIASMWDTRLSFLLYSWPHSVHFQKDSPFMSVSWYIIPAITSKRDKNLFHDNFLSWWYLDTWV